MQGRIASKIAETAVSRRYDAGRVNAYEMKLEICDAIYDHLFPAETVGKSMRAVHAELLAVNGMTAFVEMQVTTVRIGDTESALLSFSTPRLLPHGPLRLDPDKPSDATFIQLLFEATDKFNGIERDRSDLLRRLTATLKRFRTVDDVRAEWPELASVADTVAPKSKQSRPSRAALDRLAEDLCLLAASEPTPVEDTQ